MNDGSVSFDKDRGRWRIEAPPHVIIKLKRVFPKVSKRAAGAILLSDTEETARDIEWFITRYPLKVSKRDRVRLTDRSAAHKERESIVDAMLRKKVPPPEFDLAHPPRDYQRLAAALTLRAGGLLLADDVGVGKAQPLDAKVLTPSGWKRMGDLRIGDRVVDPDGGEGVIEGIFPQGEREVFRVSTADGGSTVCCEEHLWLVHTPNDRVRGTSRVLTTADLREHLFEARGNGQRAHHYFLPLPKPVQFDRSDEAVLPLAPYLLGVLLGDGGFVDHAVRLSSIDADLIERVRALLPAGTYLANADGCDWRISGVARTGIRNAVLDAIRGLGLGNAKSWEKFVPTAYLQASAEDRLLLLRGLMDTDGTCSKDGRTSTFTSTSQRLARDLAEIVHSLGGATTTTSRVTSYSHNGERREGRRSWTVIVRMPVCPFAIERKVNRWHPATLLRAIHSIEPEGTQAVQCIRVSTKRRLYITDDYLVTHNTVSAICMLADRRTLPAIVVTMTHLPKQWEAEIRRFAPKLRTHIIKKGTPYDLTERPRRRKSEPDDQFTLPAAPPDALPDVIITNYHKLSGWMETLAPLVQGHAIIFDEVQELRNHESARYEAATWLAQHADFRLGLSATPIHNLGAEFFNILDVLFPGKLGTRGEFTQEWCKEGQTKLLADAATFGSYLRSSGLMLRRSRADVGRELPQLTKIIQTVDSNADALNDVSEACAELAKIILAQGGLDRGAQMNAAGQLDMKLRMATGLGKAPYVAELVRMLVENGESVVLFGWHRSVYDVWLDKLKDFAPVMYTGTESPTEKEKSKQAFVSGASKVLIMSLRAGAGLDGLQHCCRTVVIGELDWSPAVIEQNIGRVNRDGQKDPVAVYFPISDEGSDPILVDILGLKRQQLDGVREVQPDLVERLETDGDRIKKLAEAYLRRRGINLPAPPADGAAA